MALDTILAQLNPAATSLEDIYTVPVGFRGALYVVVTNRTSVSATYRISFAPAGALDSLEQYVVYDATVATTPKSTKRVALAAGTVIRVYSSTADLNFCVNGLTQSV